MKLTQKLTLAIAIGSLGFLAYGDINTRSQAIIEVKQGEPGMRGLLTQYPRTAVHLTGLAQELLRGQSTLSQGERELIFFHVSSLNKCNYCSNSHSAAATALLDGKKEIVDMVKADPEQAPISNKLKALLVIAGKVQVDPKTVNNEDKKRALDAGATNQEIHDAGLIAAFACMCNKYVDAFTAKTSTDTAAYQEAGQMLAKHGYVRDHSKN